MAQVLFNITCETCSSRLQVRSREAIGQILTCPRCASMVQIVPPPGWIDSPTPIEASDTLPEGAASSTEVRDPKSSVSSATDFELPTAGLQAPASAVPPPVPGAETPQPMPPVWASPVERLTRKAVLIGAGMGFCLFAAVGAAYWLTSDEGTMAQAPAVEVADTVDAADAPTSAPIVKSSKGDNSEPQEASLADNTSAGPPEVRPFESTPPVHSPPGDRTGEAFPDREPPEQPTSAVDSATDRLPATDQKSADPSAVPDADVLAAKLEELAKAVAAPGDGGPTSAIQIDDEVDDSELEVDVPARLADRLPRIDIRGAPLADFVALLSSLSTVSITLDLDALAAAGLDIKTPIQVAEADIAVGDLLTIALRPHGLIYESSADGAVVTTPAAVRSELRAFSYPVDDLVEPTPAGLDSFGRLLQHMVAPASWQSGGGPGSIEPIGDRLRIRQTYLLHYDLVEFCEKLRVARSKPLRSKYPRKLFELTDGDRLPAAVRKPVTFTFHRPTRLSQLRGHLQQLSGMTVLVDWQALAKMGLSPRTRITCAVDDRPMADALDDVLRPLELSWRMVGDHAIEITSRAAAAQRFERAFYDMAPMLQAGITGEALVAGIRKVASPESWRNSGGRGYVYFDVPSSRLIVRQTAPVQRDIVRLVAGLRQKVAAGQAAQ